MLVPVPVDVGVVGYFHRIDTVPVAIAVEFPTVPVALADEVEVTEQMLTLRLGIALLLVLFVVTALSRNQFLATGLPGPVSLIKPRNGKPSPA